MNFRRILGKLNDVERTFEQIVDAQTSRSSTGSGSAADFVHQNAFADSMRLKPPEDRKTYEDIDPDTGKTLTCEQCFDKYSEKPEEFYKDCKQQAADCKKKYWGTKFTSSISTGGCFCTVKTQTKDGEPYAGWYVKCNNLPLTCSQNGIGTQQENKDWGTDYQGCTNDAAKKTKEIQKSIDACCDFIAGITFGPNGNKPPGNCIDSISRKLKNELIKLYLCKAAAKDAYGTKCDPALPPGFVAPSTPQGK